MASRKRSYDNAGRESKEETDFPPGTRLFIIGTKDISKEKITEKFEEFGPVKSVLKLVDRNTGSDKGVAYVAFYKASEAAMAKESMHGRNLENNPRPIKVVFAEGKNSNSGRVSAAEEEDMNKRLFIRVPKSYTESDIEDVFKEYGDIEFVKIIKENQTNVSKGLAFVRYHRAYHAALALENVDSSYAPIFADRKSNNTRPESRDSYSSRDNSDSRDNYGYGSRGGGEERGYGGRSFFERESASRSRFPSTAQFSNSYTSQEFDVRSIKSSESISSGPWDIIRNYHNTGEERLEAIVSAQLSDEHVRRLFDIVPGLISCYTDRSTGITTVKYSNPQCASYARDKLNDLEYPLGQKLNIRIAQGSDFTRDSSAPDELAENISNLIKAGKIDNLQSLLQTVQNSKHDQGRTSSSSFGGVSSGLTRVNYTDVFLPPLKPMAPPGSLCVQRLFIVCQSEMIPRDILTDALRRFGDLMEIYVVQGRKFCFAKFASKESADHAMEVLNNQMLYGTKIKVMPAEPKSGDAGSEEPESKKLCF